MLDTSSKSPESTRNGTPVAQLEALNLATKNNNSPSPAAITMTPTQTPSPSGTPQPGLKFSFAKGAAPTRPALTSSNLSNGITAFHGHDSDSDDDTRKTSKITHLENGAVVGEQVTREDKKPLVIKPPESHHDHWLQRRLKMFRPDMVDKKPENVDLSGAVDRIGDDKIKVGLQITKRSTPPITDTDVMIVDKSPEPAKTEDELAEELLLRQAQDPNTTISTVPKLVISARDTISEADVYAYDMAHLSDAPTLETYERVPVEAFGMGILLGLGWKEGTDLKGQKTETFKEPKKRPDFLGIGATEEEFLRMDAKGNKLSRKDGLGGSWNPLKKIDKKTGEVIVDVKPSRTGTPSERHSGVSTPQNRSRYGTPSGGHSGYGSERDRQGQSRRDDDQDGKSRRDDDRDRRKDKYRSEERRALDDRDGRYDSDREGKRKDRGYDSERRSNRDYDSDYDRKRRREGTSVSGSRHGSRRPSPLRKRSRSPRKGR